MLPFKANLPMAMAITCMLKTATMAPCLNDPASNGSYGSYFNTLYARLPSSCPFN